jgi:CBS domain-containing protein
MLPLLVNDLMSRDALTLNSHYSVRQAARIMIDLKIDAIMIIEDNEIIGIVTIRDILNSTLEDKDTNITSVGDLVDEKSLILVRPSTSLDKAAALMKQYDTKILPVVSDDLEGFIYYEDLAEQRPDLFTKRSTKISVMDYII